MLKIFSMKQFMILLVVIFPLSNIFGSENEKFYQAVFNNNIQLAKSMLKENKSLLNEKDSNGDTPLHIAIKKNNIKMIRLMLSYPMNINTVNNDGFSPLLLAVFQSASANNNALIAVKFLLEYPGVNKTFRHLNGYDALCMAAQDNNIKMFKLLLFYSAGDKEDILLFAAKKKLANIVKLILKDLNFNLSNEAIRGFLEHIIKGGNKELMDYFLFSPETEKIRKSYNFNSKDYNADTILHLLCWYSFRFENKDIVNRYVEAFIENGTDLELRNKQGKRACFYYCSDKFYPKSCEKLCGSKKPPKEIGIAYNKNKYKDNFGSYNPSKNFRLGFFFKVEGTGITYSNDVDKKDIQNTIGGGLSLYLLGGGKTGVSISYFYENEFLQLREKGSDTIIDKEIPFHVFSFGLAGKGSKNILLDLGFRVKVPTESSIQLSGDTAAVNLLFGLYLEAGLYAEIFLISVGSTLNLPFVAVEESSQYEEVYSGISVYLKVGLLF